MPVCVWASWFVTAGGTKAVAAAAASPAERIGAVVDTLKDVLKSTENAEKDEAQNFKCYMQWCEGEVQAKEREIDDGENELEQLQVQVNTHTASQKRYEYQIGASKEDIEEITDAINDAESMRNRENQKYDREATIEKQSISQVDQAITIVQRQGQLEGFLQKNKGRALTAQQTAGLTQLSEPGESSMVLGVMQSLKTNLVRNLGAATDTEEKKAAMHERLMRSKKIQLTEINADVEKKGILLAEASGKLAEAKSDISTTTKDLDEDKAYLEDVTKECETKQKDWELRSNDRAQEKAAIREAISYLMITFAKQETEEKQAAALLAQKRQMQQQQDEDFKESQVESFVQVDAIGNALEAMQTATDGMDQLGNQQRQQQRQQVGNEQFSGVKKTIKELIKVTQQEQTEADKKFKYCESRQKSNEVSLADMTDQSDRLDALVSKKTNMIQGLTQEVSEIEALMKEKEEADKTAKRLRDQDHAAYEKAAKENALAYKVLGEARRVLQQFYASKDKSGALIQAQSEAAPKTWEGSSRKSGENNVVLAMMDKIMDDLKIEIKESKVDEEDAAQAYEKYVKEARVEFDARMALITQKVTRKAKLEVQLGAAKEDQDSTREELNAVNGKIAAWRSQCETHLAEHKKETQQRSFEVSQLRDAHDILSGSTEAVRTALVAIQKAGQMSAVVSSAAAALGDAAALGVQA